jgi:hypothetical protein
LNKLWASRVSRSATPSLSSLSSVKFSLPFFFVSSCQIVE